MFYCPKCGNELIKDYPDGKRKLRTNIIVWEKDKAICKCNVCHGDVEIPISLNLKKEL